MRDLTRISPFRTPWMLLIAFTAAVFLGVSLLMAPSPARADLVPSLSRAPRTPSLMNASVTITAPVDQDSYLWQGAATTNFGGATLLHVQESGTGDGRRSVLRFDLSQIPPSTQVLSATAYFFVHQDASIQPVNVHRVTTAWTEAGVTWNNTAAGYHPDILDSFVPATLDVFVAADVTGVAQGWINGTTPNHGLMLISSVADSISKYTAKEWGIPGELAYLEVVAARETVADDFDPDTRFGGNDGSQDWTGPWQEWNEDNGPLSGSVRVGSDLCVAGQCLGLDSATQDLDGVGFSRAVNLGAAISATLSFSYRRDLVVDDGVLVNLDVSSDRGLTWATLATYFLNTSDTSPVTQSLDLTPYLAPEITVRFMGSGMPAGRNRFFVDDVQIAYTPGASTGLIGGRIWDDEDRDATAGGGEPGLNGLSVALYQGNCGTLIQPALSITATTGDGNYQFAALAGGDYCVQVEPGSLPITYTTTNGKNPQFVSLAVGEAYTQADFSFASAIADDRLNVGVELPCSDITWLEDIAADHSATFLHQDLDHCVFTLAFPSAEGPSLQQEIQGDSRTRYAGWDIYTAAAYLPNDPDFNNPSKVFGPQQINAPAAWDLTMGDPQLILAIVDTGVDTDHQEFVGRAMLGWDFVNDDGDPADDAGHGTHVAGIALAGIDNGMGIAGIAGQVKLLPVKVLNQNNTGWMSDIAAGVTWAADQGARVINLSLGGTLDSLALQDAVAHAEANGALVVAAAGNSGYNTLVYPASYANVLAVGATTFSAVRWSLSNYGDNVDIMAPGSMIYSTHWKSGVPNAYAFLSGTSMASPHVAGVAALLLSLDPSLSPSHVRQILTSTATDMGDPGYDSYHGYGLVNAGLAVAAVLDSLELPQLTKAVDRGTAGPGDSLAYTITARYPGDALLQNVLITDAVPAGTLYAGFAGPAPSAQPPLGGSGTVIWNLGSNSPGTPGLTALAPSTVGEQATLSIEAGIMLSVEPTLVNPGDLITVTMVLTASNAVAGVTPNLQVLGTNGIGATLVGGPAPPIAEVDFDGTPITWQFQAAAAGNIGQLQFSGNASDPGVSVLWPWASSNSIIVAPPLTFQVTVENPSGVAVVQNTAYFDEDSGVVQPASSNVVTTSLSASIGDLVWRDLNGDGMQGAGEPGLTGIQVELSDGIDVVTATTDADGLYNFGGLDAGTYTVTLDSASVPVSYTLVTTANPIVVVLSAGEGYHEADFGLKALDAAVGDFLWYDVDGDGQQDPGEPGIGNVTLDLYRDDGDGSFNPGLDTLLDSAVTDARGAYRLDAPGAGQVFVLVTDNHGLLTGLDPTLGPHSVGNPSPLISLTNGILHADADFGFVRTLAPGQALVGDLVWLDGNGNGLRNQGEPVLIGVEVCAAGEGDDPVTCATTNLNGRYQLVLEPGSYDIAPTASPFGLTPTLPVPQRVTLVAGQQVLTVDFGYTGPSQNLGSLGGEVWSDQQVDGVYDHGSEVGIAGVSIDLVQDMNGDGQWTAGESIVATLSDLQGLYSFPALLPDNYLLYAADTLLNLRNHAATVPGPNPDADDNNHLQPYATNLLAGEVDHTVDFGYRSLSASGTASLDTGSIGNQVWADGNGDGQRDPGAGDFGIAGVTVELRAGPLVLATATTGSDGQYLFTNLPAGNYSVQVTDAFGVLLDYPPAPLGLSPGQDDNSQAQPYAVSLDPGQVNLTADFAYVPVRPGDCNGDRLIDAGDLSALVLEVFDGDGILRGNAHGGTFRGYGGGCDANQDGIIDAGDLSCVVLIAFQGPEACGVPQGP